MGSAGSAKSYFITQKLLIRALNTPIKVMVCRRYGSTLRNTCFALFKEVLTKWRLINMCEVNKSNLTITLPNGSEFIFMGLDSETKLLSLTGITCIFVEEAYEVPRDIVEQLNLRLRGGKDMQILMAWNPINKTSWLYNFTQELPDDALYIHSTYKDNPFLDASYIKQLESLRVTNPAKAKIYCDGNWGTNPEGLVIQNWRVDTFDPMQLAAAGCVRRCGMDLGWVDQSAVIDTLYDEEAHRIYVFNEYVKSGSQLSDLAAAIESMGIKKSKTLLYVDAAEPRAIAYFRQQGINARACKKGRDSVNAGLGFLRDNEIIVHPKCTAFINELKNFSYIKSKVTGEWTNETTHEYSHAIDGCRYAYSDIYTTSTLKVLPKNCL